MSNIKIFVSHRIDLDSETVENPIYLPVRCGAVYDEKESSDIQGDDIGNNISERRMSFCEYTVQYWAWKNVEANYYGLCHYRRYLSFAQRTFKTDGYNMVQGSILMPRSKVKYGLLNWEIMEQTILENDIVVSEYADVRKIPTIKGKKETVYKMWEAYIDVFFEKSSLDLLFQLIDTFSPEYSTSAREYFSGNYHRGFNCYVMKKELFNRLCEFQFPIMFEVERRIDTTNYSRMMIRTTAFLGEMLYGIFMYHVTTYEHWKVKELQLVFFNNTNKIKGTFDLFKKYFWHIINRGLRIVIDPIMPVGSQRREALKDLYYKFTPAVRRGIENLKE